ncbi:MAG: enoyl-CoA hydratase/isomerase family protein [Burkholderiales bacterium]|jgi:methylglutaconyl-CoA hydratase|nr:enoyl-CoA hydratase/isomerase family protein [Burkholderiales bacterium]
MNPTTLEIQIAHRVAVVWLARPQVRNAFNDTVIAELTASFERLGADDGVRAVVLAAQGPAFCAGADLEWMRRMSGYSPEENHADALKLATLLRTIHDCPKPVVARVHGDAYAGGVGLVAACDIAVAALAAEFCLSETRLGLVPATISPYVIGAMGARQARRYMVTAEKFDASEAFRVGLVHELAAPDELDVKINTLLGALMVTSGSAVATTKQLVREVAQRPLDDALLAHTAQVIAQARAAPDGREGVAAFLAKRKPRWAAEFEAEQAQLRAAQDDGAADDDDDPAA